MPIPERRKVLEISGFLYGAAMPANDDRLKMRKPLQISFLLGRRDHYEQKENRRNTRQNVKLE